MPLVLQEGGRDYFISIYEIHVYSDSTVGMSLRKSMIFWYSLGSLDNEAEGHMLNGKGRDVINTCPLADCSEYSGGKTNMWSSKYCIIMHMSK